jgi:4-hydroxy-tetrahydrodipicolinate reductase
MKIAIIGYGKMGKAVEAAALEAGHEIVMRHNAQSAELALQLSSTGADVAIEFTKPASAFRNIISCLDAGIPVVCGTTGWLEQMPSVSLHCQQTNGAIFYASNFSIGVFLFTELNRILARWMQTQPQYEVSITETHHTQKKDAPSGTAITLAETLMEGLTRKKGWVAGSTDEPALIGVESIRLNEVPGTHTIRFHSEQDSIILNHEAHSRVGFALGALHAAAWIQHKKGVFGMRDMVLPPGI